MAPAPPARRSPFRAATGTIAFGTAVSMLVSAAPLHANTEDAELIYECGLAMQFAEKKKRTTDHPRQPCDGPFCRSDTE